MADTATWDWKPRHSFGGRGQGAIYCSPSCGAKCTKASYDEAVKASAELAKQMGPKWKPCVHENMGWWWSVVSGPITLIPPRHGTKTYTCLISDGQNPGTGLGAWTPRNSDAPNPKAAVRKALAAVRAYRDHIVEATARAEEAATN